MASLVHNPPHVKHNCRSGPRWASPRPTPCGAVARADARHRGPRDRRSLRSVVRGVHRLHRSRCPSRSWPGRPFAGSVSAKRGGHTPLLRAARFFGLALSLSTGGSRSSTSLRALHVWLKEKVTVAFASPAIHLRTAQVSAQQLRCSLVVWFVLLATWQFLMANR